MKSPDFKFLKDPRTALHYLVVLSGLAALSWEVIWQIKSSLALGVSAWGAALTLAIMMGGMSIGALAAGGVLERRGSVRPLRLYGILEITIGLSGLFLIPAFGVAQGLDTRVYASHPDMAQLVYITGIVMTLGLPSLCLGATLPVLGLTARQYNTALSRLYGLNTLGAAAGAMIVAFVLIPLFGIAKTVYVVAAINIMVGIVAIRMDRGTVLCAKIQGNNQSLISAASFRLSLTIVFVTGFATFALEVAWFRSLRAAFMSTTDAFAIMLCAVLVAIGFGARMVGYFKKRGYSLGVILALAGILILLATPVVERFDLFIHVQAALPIIVYMEWFFLTLYVIGPPVLLLAVALPWILNEQDMPYRWGVLYGVNTFAAIAGSLLAAWVFLPHIGFARTSWIVGVMVSVAGLIAGSPGQRTKFGSFCLLALFIAVAFESGVGRTRVQGTKYFDAVQMPQEILESYEGPDVTASVAAYEDGGRVLFIDGFSTASQTGGGALFKGDHYMPWMGHLPMLAHPDPQSALVICFGTGQTANAVRKEGVQTLDIVDINKNVFKLAHHFAKNEDVLADPKVNQVIMDGRAYIRRSDKIYDVITLEPMPPNFAGVNALYSREFYALARGRLSGNGVIAQWLPFHLLGPYYSASIARTFQDVFPNAVLWIDPLSSTGILLGSKDDNMPLGTAFPGFARRNIERTLSPEAVKRAVFLNREDLARYGTAGAVITDDNQNLAYGSSARELRSGEDRNRTNFELIENMTGKRPSMSADRS